MCFCPIFYLKYAVLEVNLNYINPSINTAFFISDTAPLPIHKYVKLRVTSGKNVEDDMCRIPGRNEHGLFFLEGEI